MATSERVVINPDHLEGGDGTVAMALQLWSSRNGPVKYNVWQSLYFQLCRDGYVDATAPGEAEDQAQRQTRIRALQAQIQEELHGPDHMAQAIRADPGGSAKIPVRLEELKRSRPLAGQGQGSVAAPALTRQRVSGDEGTCDRAGCFQKPSGTSKYCSQDCMEADKADRNALGLGDQGSGRDAALTLATQAIGQAELEGGTDAYGTPRGDALPAADSPDRLILRVEAEKIWDEDAATHTEATEEQDERLERLAARLAEPDGSQSEVEFVLRVEQLVAEYKSFYGDWLAEDPERDGKSLQLFAMEKLVELSADSFVQETEFKHHVFALGRLAGRTVDQSRHLGKSLWYTSARGTPLQESGRDAAPRLLGMAATPGDQIAGSTPGKRPPSQSSPGPATPSVDLVNAMETVTKGFQGAMEKVVGTFAELQALKEPDDPAIYRSEKLQAITSLEFKRTPPTIRDDDPDLDRYDQEFDTAVACYAFGGRKVREVDKLHLYGNGFKEGSTRRKVFDNSLRRATRLNRIPVDAKAVLEEIRKELRTYIWETKMQKQVRLDKKFEALEQGGMGHADFRALWESNLQDMEESGMDMPTSTTLYRKYLTKLNAELRVGLLSKEWKVDGPECPPRPLQTHHDVAVAAGLWLEEKADIHATGDAAADTFMVIGGKGAIVPKVVDQGKSEGSRGAAVV